MQINIGTVITMKGKKWYCVEITTQKQILLADALTVLNWSGQKVQNFGRTTVLASESTHFSAGDIITLEYEKIEFKEVDGSDWMTIYPYYKIKKEITASGHKGAESGAEQASGSEVESVGEGPEDRSGVGRESAS